MVVLGIGNEELLWEDIGLVEVVCEYLKGRAFCTEDLRLVEEVVVADESEELFVQEILV